MQQVLEKLPAELKAQQKNHTAVMRRLRSESATWLSSLDLHGPKNVCDAFILHWCETVPTLYPPLLNIFCRVRIAACRHLPLSNCSWTPRIRPPRGVPAERRRVCVDGFSIWLR